MAYWQHETAIVDAGAQIGDGTKIWHFSHVCGSEVHIGRDCSLGQNVYVGPKVKIGNGVRIQNNVSVYDLVELEDSVFCGPSAVFTNVINPRSHVPRKAEFKRTLVRRGASLGANCTIVCGIEIGQFALIGAGAVVTKNVPDFALMIGVPARPVGWVCQCGVQLEDVIAGRPTVCRECMSEYLLKGDTLVAVHLTGKWERE